LAEFTLGSASLLIFIISIGNTFLSIRFSPDDKKPSGIIFRIILPALLILFAFLFEIGFPLNFGAGIVLLLFYYPGIIVMVENFPQAFAWAMETLLIMFRAIASFHKPQQTSLIVELLHSDMNDEMKVIDLSGSQLEKIREWANNNQETSEKRLNPLLILLAFFALFGGSEWFRHHFSSLYEYIVLFFSNSISVETWGIILLISIFVSLVLSFLFQIISIFRNISIQSLIAETCIVAEYEASVREEKARKTELVRPTKPTLMQILRSWFRKK
jgi:hypothetical protein